MPCAYAFFTTYIILIASPVAVCYNQETERDVSICDRKHLKGSSYSGVPKFIVETLSPSTAKRDRSEKKDIYEKAGVEEYWIVSPQGLVEIYYLENGKYILEENYMLQKDKEDELYNAETEICLKEFPHIKMTLGEIFEGVE